MLKRKKNSLYVCKVIASMCDNIRKRKKRYVSQGGSKQYRVDDNFEAMCSVFTRANTL
jgi:hypothetical protein